MALAFVVGDKFRHKVTQLLEKTESALPRGLKEELEEILGKTETAILHFSTAKTLKKYLQDQGKNKELHVYSLLLKMLLVCITYYSFTLCSNMQTRGTFLWFNNHEFAITFLTVTFDLIRG